MSNDNVPVTTPKATRITVTRDCTVIYRDGVIADVLWDASLGIDAGRPSVEKACKALLDAGFGTAELLTSLLTAGWTKITFAITPSGAVTYLLVRIMRPYTKGTS